MQMNDGGDNEMYTDAQFNRRKAQICVAAIQFTISG